MNKQLQIHINYDVMQRAFKVTIDEHPVIGIGLNIEQAIEDFEFKFEVYMLDNPIVN